MQGISNQIMEKARAGILRPRDLAAIPSARRHLAELVQAGKLTKIGRGLYQAGDFPVTEHHSLAETAKRFPGGVICLLSALQFHGLTLELPSEVWVAIRRGKAIPRTNDRHLRVFQISEPMFAAGIETHDIEGVPVRIYSAAKTVADCFRFRSHIGSAVAFEALKNAWQSGKASGDELVRCAKLCRVLAVMEPYLETLTL
jgi:predicted transcriptional regulator of viral defense system